MDTTTETTQSTKVPGPGASFRNLYFHFPFCEAKCHYCDFFSLPEAKVAGDRQAAIYEALVAELQAYEPYLASPLETVYLGGGTPSLAPMGVLERIFGAYLMPRLTPQAVERTPEITIEANPSSISFEKAKAWRALGINRVSMGIQSMNDARLRWLGRVHSSRTALEALTALTEAGFESISVDFIVGVPGQSANDIDPEISSVIGRFPAIKHVSAYLLTLKASNPKFHELPDDEEQLLQLQTVRDVLVRHGFEQYEISNFARPGARARHNENYWLGGSYLGIGPSAHSYWAGSHKRTKNWGSLEKYAALLNERKLPIEWEESLSAEEERVEHLMLQLRRSDGLDLEQYKTRFGRDLVREHGALIRQWQNKGLCRLDARFLRLTSDGFFLSDQLLSQIV